MRKKVTAILLVAVIMESLLFNNTSVKAVGEESNIPQYLSYSPQQTDRAVQYKDAALLFTEDGQSKDGTKDPKMIKIDNGQNTVIPIDNAQRIYAMKNMGIYNNKFYLLDTYGGASTPKVYSLSLNESALKFENYAQGKCETMYEDGIVDNNGTQWFKVRNPSTFECKIINNKGFEKRYDRQLNALKKSKNNGIYFMGDFGSDKNFLVRVEGDSLKEYQFPVGYNFVSVVIDKNNDIYAAYRDNADHYAGLGKYKIVGDNLVLDKKVSADVSFPQDGYYYRSMTTDDNGDVWIVIGGRVSKLINNNFKTKYIVDQNITNLSIYDDNHFTVYGEIGYTVITGDKATPSVKEGWNLIDGKWCYVNSDGRMKTKWNLIDRDWYYLGYSGAMQTGWILLDNTWYYFEGSGVMRTGWISSGYKWYYLGSNGAMKTNWVLVNNKWYFLYKDGSMAVNTTINGYKIGSDGAWIK